MQVNISDKDLEELINTGQNNKYKRYSKNPEGLRLYSFLHYEKLANNVNLSSVRIVNGRVERLLFEETNDGIEITIIELNTQHYGNKK